MDMLLVLLPIGGLIWFWVDSLRAKEAALKRCNALCNEMNVQLLDQTVRIARIRPGKDRCGRLRLRRFYAYEFSTDGEDRCYGLAVLLGSRVEYLRLEHPSGPIIHDYAQ